MKNMLIGKKLSTLILSVLLILMGTMPIFAETQEEIVELSLSEYRDLVVKKDITLRNLKDSREDLADTITMLDKNSGYMLYGGDRTTGYKEQKKGSYYEYAYPNFVRTMNLEAQLATMDAQINLMEVGYVTAADTVLFKRDTLEKQLELSDQNLANVKRSYDEILEKAELGLVSKVDLETAKINLENTQFSRDQLYYALKGFEYTVKSTASLEPDKTYRFVLPEFTDSKYDSNAFLEYYEMAKETNQVLAAAKVNMEALENEKKFITMYKNFVIASDLADFDRRYEDGQYEIKRLEKEIYKNLYSALSEYYKLEDEIDVAQSQIEYDSNMLKKLAQMEEQGQVTATQRLQYETAVSKSKIDKLSLIQDKILLSQKIDLLVSFGISL
ncbi:TolC family protein [Fusibacter ferrireducens]|uniref:TolC family protein n=1 Tax=Fusibacter ferrireducens TaxID=2785058 RepID=A0ABR9ZY90_9FIRM|nr:TolC family protein [Fusibacter ferrireducens]MBF4695118.1 TolC family protein [Fusibacter ferrireducens]